MLLRVRIDTRVLRNAIVSFPSLYVDNVGLLYMHNYEDKKIPTNEPQG